MWYFSSFLLGILLHHTFGFQNQYSVVQENITVSHVDHSVVEAAAGIFHINETTNGLNFTYMSKIEVPLDVKFSAMAAKRINGEYILDLLHFSKNVQSVLQMEMFDLEALFVNYCRPPMVWPIGKGVYYHCIGWTPDSTKFPPNLPAGQWKVQVSPMFANQTKIFDVTWYIKLNYKK